MNPLVRIKGNDVFTNSMVVAEGTGVEHRKVKDRIRKYRTSIEQLGLLASYQAESTGGRPEDYYLLNEPQATFLITLLKNTPNVVAFKLSLVQEFYRMRQIILQRSTAEWQEIRQMNKVNRIRETDEIKHFVEYCEAGGSKNAKRYYSTITRLANKAVGIEADQRGGASCETLQILNLVESTIRHTIAEEMDRQTEYHKIYFICKRRILNLMSYIYLPEQRLLPTGT